MSSEQKKKMKNGTQFTVLCTQQFVVKHNQREQTS